MSLDFTLQKYGEFCDTLKRLACPIMTVRQFIEKGQPYDFIVVLRHDIDRSLPSAIRMANLEAEYGISASYYVRMTRQVFRPSEIKKITQFGHEVGYHYEVLAKANGNVGQAISIFENELMRLRQIVPVYTITMHGSPLWPWSNLDIWQKHDFKFYNLIGEASLSINYSKLYYFTDTGRSWDAGRCNLRDRVDSKKTSGQVHSTDHLIRFLMENSDGPVLINTHPNRWTTNRFGWFISTLTDWSANQLKWLISSTRRHPE